MNQAQVDSSAWPGHERRKTTGPRFELEIDRKEPPSLVEDQDVHGHESRRALGEFAPGAPLKRFWCVISGIAEGRRT